MYKLNTRVRINRNLPTISVRNTTGPYHSRFPIDYYHIGHTCFWN